MNEDLACGKGLARHAVLSAKLGDVIAAGAEVLELHARALNRRNRTRRQSSRPT